MADINENSRRENMLQFNKPLLGKVSAPIAAGELVKRLKELYTELADIEQDENRDDLTAIAKSLVDSTLVKHKDMVVRAFTSCCLAEILRLFAPDAPYTVTQLTVGPLAVTCLIIVYIRALYKDS